MPVYLIGGAHEAAELDAKRVIKQATYLAAEIWRNQVLGRLIGVRQAYSF